MSGWVSNKGNPIEFTVYLKEKGSCKKDNLFWHKGTFFGLDKQYPYEDVSFYSEKNYPLKQTFKVSGFLKEDERLIEGKVYSGYRFIFPKSK